MNRRVDTSTLLEQGSKQLIRLNNFTHPISLLGFLLFSFLTMVTKHSLAQDSLHAQAKEKVDRAKKAEET